MRDVSDCVLEEAALGRFSPHDRYNRYDAIDSAAAVALAVGAGRR